MRHSHTGRVTAVLGPTNTGKTHLAVERLCAHSSGVMGFPLRLLAREIYDRVVSIKGPGQVGLITGEEKIVPPGARWFLCTAESMPLERDVAFVALDEAQLAADPERGHIFTQRLLQARGREETMILGSETLRPVLKSLLPEAEIVGRPRFSRLTYDGPRKLTRLQPRSAVVAFSADQVYAAAEMLRRTRGGAAVVMGALSPRTRNAQVAMYQAGEVDFLVATDAIGMGLNMDIGHVCFASLAKFDGKRQRRLSPAEMAQIAGRAGRHQRDGTFGSLLGGESPAAFTEIEIDRIENHRFAALDHLYWRNDSLDFASIDTLIASLEVMPEHVPLRPAPLAIDHAVLKVLAGFPSIGGRALGPDATRRLWEVCQLPDFRKLGPEQHAQLAARIFEQLEENGSIAHDWIAAEIARLDNVQGDVDTLSGRIAGVRTWAYAAQRDNWLRDPGEWRARASALEEKLSDALHARLTERFVNRRAAALMRSAGRAQAYNDVVVHADGIVSVEGESIGRLTGFDFAPDPDARLGEKRALLAAADLHLGVELQRRARELAEARDDLLSLKLELGHPVAICWHGAEVARLSAGANVLQPRINPDRRLAEMSPDLYRKIQERLQSWLAKRIESRLAPLKRLYAEGQRSDAGPALRAIFSQIAAGGGAIARSTVAPELNGLGKSDRKRLRDAGIVIGALDMFHPALIKPGAVMMRSALAAVREGRPVQPLPMAGLGLLDRPDRMLAASAETAGYRRFGSQMLRVDLVERIARAAHDGRNSERTFVPDPALAQSIGIGDETLSRVLQALGFHPMGGEPPNRWHWRGHPRVRRDTRPDNPAFAALARLRRR